MAGGVFRVMPQDMNFGSLFDMFRSPSGALGDSALPSRGMNGDKRIILVDGESPARHRVRPPMTCAPTCPRGAAQHRPLGRERELRNPRPALREPDCCSSHRRDDGISRDQRHLPHRHRAIARSAD